MMNFIIKLFDKKGNYMRSQGKIKEMVSNYINKKFLISLIIILLYGYLKGFLSDGKSLLFNIISLTVVYLITRYTIKYYGVAETIKRYTKNVCIKFGIILFGIILLEVILSMIPYIYVSSYVGFLIGVDSLFYRKNS